MVSMTSEPLSDEVMKKTATRTMPNRDIAWVNGRTSNMAKSFTSSAASATAR